MNELNTLAQRLRYAMEVLPPKKIKGVDLARAVGVKPPSVSDWLSGKSKTMEGENLLKTSKFLGINPIWLATGKGDHEFEHQTNKYRDFAIRLNTLMQKQESPIKTINQLKDSIDVTYEMARRYTLGTAKPREEKMQILAEKFNVDISYLDHGIGLDTNVSNPFPVAGRLVPVISWVQAGNWTSAEGVPAGTQFEEWLPPNPKCGKNGYGLEVVGESMLPDFRPHDRIYVNPDFQISDLKTGDLVIVSNEGDKAATFKKLIVETDNMYLQPLNPEWSEKAIALEDGCKLVGKVVGLYRDV